MSNVIRIDPSNAMNLGAFDSSFGGAGARSLLDGDRFQELDRRQRFYACTQHDGKYWDFDGRPINPRTGMQPLLGAERSWYVPLKMRRPSSPVRLGRIIVDSFTNLLFGENRFPNVRVEGDDQTEDLLRTIVRIGKLSQKMVQARAIGGAVGTVGLSWCFRNGRPRFEAHDPKNLFVHSWEDRLELVPEHVTEIYLFSKVKWDGRGFNKIWHWFRRDWTPAADIVFVDQPYDPNREPVWEVDFERSNFHGDGVCHLEWIQNLPSDEADGLPDYDGLYESFDALDLLMSVISRGAILNLDPTLVMKMDRDEVDRLGIKKGSDNALVVGKDGGAEYLEVGGGTIEAGLKLVESKRRFILETAQCIVPDPHEVAAQGVSSIAIKAMFAPMLSKCDVLREQYGSAIERMLMKMVDVLRDKLTARVLIVDPETKAETPGKFVLNLPPKIEMEQEYDVVDNMPTGKEVAKKTPRTIGGGGEVTLVWPPYFAPTPQDQTQIVTALQTATGGKAFMSKETAAEVTARAFGIEPSEEKRRLQEDQKAQKAAEASMLPDIGGAVEEETELPDGAAPKGGAAAPGDHEEAKAEEAATAAGAPPGHPEHETAKAAAKAGKQQQQEDPDADIPIDVDLTGGPGDDPLTDPQALEQLTPEQLEELERQKAEQVKAAKKPKKG